MFFWAGGWLVREGTGRRERCDSNLILSVRAKFMKVW